MKKTIFRVFVSSTWIDLQPERHAIRDALTRLREIQTIGMESFGSRDETARRASIDEVGESDVYVGVFAGRYGSGITWEEYSCAHKRGLPCFIYIKKEASIPPEWHEIDAHASKKLQRIKQELRARHVVQEFEGADSLATLITADLHRWLTDDRGLTTRLLEYADQILTNQEFREWEQQQYFELRVGKERTAFQIRMRVKSDAPTGREQRFDNYSIDEAISKYRRLAIIGEPGAVKTTALKHIAVSYARKFRDAYDHDSRDRSTALPVYIWLPRFNTVSGSTNYSRVLLLVQDSLSRFGTTIDEEEVLLLLKSVPVVLLLDGLNEVGDENVSLFLDGLASFASIHADTLFVITSRTHNYRDLKHGYPVLELLEMEYPEGIENYLHCYLSDESEVKQIMDALHMNMPLRNLALNPLLLMLMIVLFKRRGIIPGSRGELLQEIAFGLLSDWRLADSHSDTLGATSSSGSYWVKDKHLVLQSLGYQMKTLGLEIPRDQVLEILHSFGERKGTFQPLDNRDRPAQFAQLGASTNWSNLLDELIGNRILFETKKVDLSDGTNTIRFWHQTMQEYFAAAYIWDEIQPLFVEHQWGIGSTLMERRRLKGKLKSYLHDPKWHEIVAIVSGLISKRTDRSLFSTKRTVLFKFIDYVWRADKLLAAMCISNTKNFDDAKRLGKYARSIKRRISFWGIVVPRIYPWLLLGLFSALVWLAPFYVIESFLAQAAEISRYPNVIHYSATFGLALMLGGIGLLIYFRSWVLGIEQIDRFANARFLRPLVSALKYIRSDVALNLLTELDVKTRDDFSIGEMARSTITMGLVRSARNESEIIMMLDQEKTRLEAIERLGELGNAKAFGHLRRILDRRDIDDLAYASAVTAAVRLAKFQSISGDSRQELEVRLRDSLASEASYSKRLAAYRGLQDLGVTDAEPPTRGVMTWMIQSGLVLTISVGLLLLVLIVLLRAPMV